MRATSRRLSLLWIPLLVSSACGGGQSTSPDDAIAVATDDPRLAALPEFIDELRDDPFQYYRFINVPFSEAVCAELGAELDTMPVVNLHGDAHLEQYAMTSEGRGLADFDDSSTGPALLDIVRFASSIEIAAEARGLGDASVAVASFLRGYRQGLEEPDMVAPEPAFVTEVRSGFGEGRADFLAMCEGIMESLEPSLEADVREAARIYAERLIEASDRDWADHHFDVVSVGGLNIGTGSRLDAKFLVRFEAESLEPDDDVVVEFKEVRDLSGISCLSTGTGGGAFRVLIGHARIGGESDPYLAPVPRLETGIFAETLFWGRAWEDHYQEFETDADYVTLEALEEMAFDVGAQLGRGHIQHIAAPLDAQLRVEMRALLDQMDAELLPLVSEMTRRSMDGWRAFREATE